MTELLGFWASGLLKRRTRSYHSSLIISLSVAILLSPLRARAKTIAWYSGGHLTYSLQKHRSPVVDKALQMFASDMLEVTGKRTREATTGDVAIYQLDEASNKDFKTLGELRVPVLKFITHKDAFWIGVRSGHVVVVGSDGRGAAYGLLELSRMAGVSPWVEWGEVKPVKRSRLMIDDKFETTQWPAVEFRAINIEGNHWDIGSYRKLLELMLRLRANTIDAGFDEGRSLLPSGKAFRAMADSFAIVTASQHNGKSFRLHKHKHNAVIPITWHDDGYGYMMPTDGSEPEEKGGAVYHLSYEGFPHDYLWLSTTQPGLIVNEMRSAYRHGATRLWMAVVNNPKTAACQLSLFMDMAWNVNDVRISDLRGHLKQWIASQFGLPVASAITEPLAELFRLQSIRRPEMMDFSMQSRRTKHNPSGDGGVKNTLFNAEEFGNELERYINDYDDVAQKIRKAEALVDPDLREAYFSAVEYPVFSSALMATKQLQAQEARLIGRKESFHNDSEALESAARSIKAYREMERLNERYRKGKWGKLMNPKPNGLEVFGKPKLPDKLSEEEIRKYGSAGRIAAPLNDEQCIVRMAADYTRASRGVERIDLLGRSLEAIELDKGESVEYQFRSRTRGGVLRLAFIPTFSPDGGSAQVAVSIDDAQPTTMIVTNGAKDGKWAENVLTGQAIITLPVSLKEGSHTLSIKAMNDHVVLDQWMIDHDIDRHFYVFPMEGK